jgi:hypothetical protein
LTISGLLEYFPDLLLIFLTCNLCSQVENSSTAQVGGPHDAEVVEPVLAGSDVPLPDDGFTHEVNCFNLPYFESRIFNVFFFLGSGMVINAYFFSARS